MTIVAVTVGALGLGILLRGVLLATVLATHGGKAEAVGRVVELREGKRPSVIEFTPAGSVEPVRFKARYPREIGAEVDVLYSELDPRNALVNQLTARDARKVGLVLGVVGLVILGIAALLYRV